MGLFIMIDIGIDASGYDFQKLYAAVILYVFRNESSAKLYMHLFKKNGRKSLIGFLLNTSWYNSKLRPVIL